VRSPHQERRAEPDCEPISSSLTHGIATRLLGNHPVRETLPGGAKLNIDRLLPFLCVYRRDPKRQDAGTGLFVTSEASYLNAPGAATRRKGMRHLVRHISEAASSRMGAFLILEVWSGDDRHVPQAVDELTGEPLLPGPGFRILTRLPRAPQGTVATLEFELQRIKIHRQAARVDINLRSRNHPPRMTQLISATEAERINCYVPGLEICPIYRNPQTGETYEDVLRTLRRRVARALKKAFFTFALNHTSVRPQHYYVLGRKSLPKQVWTVDSQLANVSSQFKFLLLITPVNAGRSWHAFAESGYAEEPRFQYRPLETDPLLLKRRLLAIRTDRIEDPTLAHLFRQTQDELDRQITMLGDIGTPRFLPGSLQVYGAVEPPLLELARDVLRRLPDSGEDTSGIVSAQAFARRATQEIRHYRRHFWRPRRPGRVVAWRHSWRDGCLAVLPTSWSCRLDWHPTAVRQNSRGKSGCASFRPPSAPATLPVRASSRTATREADRRGIAGLVRSSSKWHGITTLKAFCKWMIAPGKSGPAHTEL